MKESVTQTSWIGQNQDRFFIAKRRLKRSALLIDNLCYTRSGVHVGAASFSTRRLRRSRIERPILSHKSSTLDGDDDAYDEFKEKSFFFASARQTIARSPSVPYCVLSDKPAQFLVILPSLRPFAFDV